MPTERTTSAPVFSFSDTAFIARQAVKFGAIFLVCVMIGRIVWNVSVKVYMALNPPAPPPPTYGFGVLPDIEFPTNVAEVSSYTLETKTGGLPAFPDQMRVFFMPLKKISLFSVDNAKQLATKLYFKLPPEELSETQYRWKQITPVNSTLDMDIVSLNFVKKLDWASDPTYLSEKNLPNQSTAVTETRTLLRQWGLDAEDTATGEAKVSYAQAVGSSLTTVPSLSEADFVRVDVFRTPVDLLYPFAREVPDKGNARLVFSGKSSKEERVVELEYTYFPIDYTTFETYPTITAPQAWQLLQEGGGYVASLDEGETDVVVRSVSLAYYDGDNPSGYIQPVYVFSGDKHFIAYVPALVAPKRETTTQ